jgi:hypothetical protein
MFEVVQNRPGFENRLFSIFPFQIPKLHEVEVNLEEDAHRMTSTSANPTKSCSSKTKSRSTDSNTSLSYSKATMFVPRGETNFLGIINNKPTDTPEPNSEQEINVFLQNLLTSLFKVYRFPYICESIC